jgi:hypothetical protein
MLSTMNHRARLRRQTIILCRHDLLDALFTARFFACSRFFPLHLATKDNFMRILSGLIRMITGLAIMGMAVYVYITNQEALEGTKEVSVVIIGQELVATPQHIIIGLITAAAIGGLIELLGIFTLVRKPKPASDPSKAG